MSPKNLADCDPMRGCDCLNPCAARYPADNPDQAQALAAIVTASIAPALRPYLQDYGDLLAIKGQNGDYLAALILACCTALLAEAEKHEGVRS